MFILGNERRLKWDKMIPEAMIMEEEKSNNEEITKKMDYTVHLLEHSDDKVQFTVDAFDLHSRLGHISVKYMDAINRSNKKLKILNLSKFRKTKCDVCARSKHRATGISRQAKSIPNEAGDLVYADLKQLAVTDIEQNNYILVMVDAATRVTIAYPMKKKSDTLLGLKKLILEYKIFFGKNVKRIQPDNEKIFVDTGVTKEWFIDQEIEVIPNPPYKKQLHGVVERAIGIMGDKMRALERDLNLPRGMFGGRLAMAACYLKNLTPTSALDYLSPYTRVTGSTAPMRHLKRIGSKVWVKERSKKTANDERAKLGILIGYGYHSKAETYAVYLVENGEFIYTDDVIVDETTTVDLGVLEEYKYDEDYKKGEIFEPDDVILKEIEADKKNNIGIGIRKPKRRMKKNKVLERGDRVTIPAYKVDDTVIDKDRILYGTVLIRFTGGRCRIKIDNTREIIAIDEKYLTNINHIDEKLIFSAMKSEAIMSYRKAMKSKYGPDFRKAMRREWNDLVYKYRVLSDKWTKEEDIPSTAQKIHMMWNMEYKADREGEKRYKARCLARGDEETKNSEDLITYSPTASKESLRLLLNMALQRDFKVFAFDIASAFLNTDMEEIDEVKHDTYFYPPPGLPGARRGYLVKKLRNIYGLATAPRYWYLSWKKYLESKGFEASETDECLYFKRGIDGKILMALLVHVDDVIVIGTKKHIDSCVKGVKEKYNIREIGYNPAKYLGINFSYDHGVIGMNQTTYIDTLKNIFIPNEETISKKITTPLVKLLEPLDEEEECATVPYRKIVGALLYIAICTRPDIAFSVMHLSRFLVRHSAKHYEAAIRVLKYLVNTKSKNLWMRKTEYRNLVQVYADADLGNDFSFKSVTGYCILVDGNLISWGAKIQKTIAQSTLEAEYVALNEATKEGLYLENLMIDAFMYKELLSNERGSADMEIYCDNARLVDSLKSGSIHGARSVRHLDIKIGWLREQLLKPNVKFSHISGEENPADLFTKPLSGPVRAKHSAKIGIR